MYLYVCVCECIWPFTHYLSLKRSLFLSKASDTTMEHIWTLHPSQLVFSLVWRILKRGHPYQHFSCNRLDKAAPHRVLLPTKAGGGGGGMMCPILLRNLFGRTCGIGPGTMNRAAPKTGAMGSSLTFSQCHFLSSQWTHGNIGKVHNKSPVASWKENSLETSSTLKGQGSFSFDTMLTSDLLSECICLLSFVKH